MSNLPQIVFSHAAGHVLARVWHTQSPVDAVRNAKDGLPMSALHTCPADNFAASMWHMTKKGEHPLLLLALLTAAADVYLVNVTRKATPCTWRRTM